MDELVTEQGKFQYYQKSLQRPGRREEESKPTLPSRFDSMLLLHSLNDYCDQITDFVGSAARLAPL